MGKFRKFTEQENEEIYAAVSQMPNNISKALKDISHKLNRAYGTLNTHWYKNLRHKRSILSTISTSGGTINNTKNSYPDKNGNIDVLESHHVVLKMLLDLPKNKREQIIAIFK